jgi:Winged helix DNA-binding domain
MARARMVGLGLWGAPADGPEDVVRHLVAMQAQEHAYARWSVGQRCGAASSLVDAELDAGRVLRTHVLRPTWHYASPADLRWLLALTGSRIESASRRRYEELGLDPRTCRRATDVIAETVATGPATRRELAQALERRRISTEDQRLPHLLLHAELHAVVCSGPMQGAQHTYAAFDERVPPGPRYSEDEALAELARRWFTTRGPASLRDFAWWSGLPAGTARGALASVQAELASEEHDGRTYWCAARPRLPRGPCVDLVQCYDESILSYTETRDVLATPAVSFPVPRHVDGFTHVVLCDGRLLGHWRVHRIVGGAEVETRLARPVDDAEQAALAAAVARYEEFVRT